MLPREKCRFSTMQPRRGLSWRSRHDAADARGASPGRARSNRNSRTAWSAGVMSCRVRDENKDLQAGELGFEPRFVVFRWHSPRIACTSQAIETPRVNGKLRFGHILRMLASQGQCCPQFAPIWGGPIRRSGASFLSCSTSSGTGFSLDQHSSSCRFAARRFLVILSPTR